MGISLANRMLVDCQILHQSRIAKPRNGTKVQCRFLLISRGNTDILIDMTPDYMTLDFNTCYQAVSKRDPRYDGQFFTGVTSTGIFCRPICAAVLPKPQNCRFFVSAAAAMQAGFRPCLRCRPESAPHSPAWNGVKTTVSRALNLIEQGALERHSVSQLAERLGIGERYLRHLFAKYVGASPKAVEKTRRTLRAKKLITDSNRPMTDIAYASGFRSIRQFNDTFHKLYGKPPTALRKTRARPLHTRPLIANSSL